MTTTYTFEQLKEDVRKEAEALRVHATIEERERLNFSELKPSYVDRCIYGQMTGYCYNDRAAVLIGKCTARFFEFDVIEDAERTGFAGVAKNANGVSVPDFEQERTGVTAESHFSAIEAYILLPEARNANLIAFLRGETETLEL